MADSRSSRRWYLFQLLAAVLGAGISLYLLVEHTRLKMGIQGALSLCNLGRYANCNVVNASRFSEFFGIPIASLGVLYFIALFLFGILHPPNTPAFRRAQVWMARLAALALVVDIWLLGIQAFALRSFCLFCMLTYLSTLAHLACNWLMLPRSDRSWESFLKGDRKRQLSSFSWAVKSVVLVAAAVGMFQYLDKTLGSSRQASLEKAKQQLLQTWRQRPRRQITISGSDAHWGNASGKVTVVVFSDFECPHCQRAAFALQTALAPEERQAQMVFKHFPLDMACNPMVQQPIHANACKLAQLAYCANEKRRFWDFHDRVFFKLSAREVSSSQDRLFEGVKNIFSRKEFDACLQSTAAMDAIRADIEQGKSLGVDSTPSVFINGKRVPFAPTVDLIRDLIQQELKG